MIRIPDGYSIRLAHSGDISHLIQADIRAAELFRPTGLIYNMPDIPDGVPAPVLKDAASADQLIVATDQTHAVGFSLITWRGGDHFYLEQLSVDPAHGRQGLGSALVQATIDMAHAMRVKAIFLSTFRGLPWNEPFYRTMGFRTIPRFRMARWMREIEQDQRGYLDISRRCFMRYRVGSRRHQ